MKKFLYARAFAPAICILSVSSLPSLHAQTVELNPVVVTANRMPVDPSLLPQGVTVITRNEIETAGFSHANEVVRWLGGVTGRIDTTGGRDQTLDLRGFGETSGSNLVILIDGVRQNEGDMSGASLSWIPVSGIERIEIVRGSSSVLYGEGATAGAINIITSQALREPTGSVSLAVGSDATREGQFALNTISGDWRFQINGTARNTDNHRDNFANKEISSLARATWTDDIKLFSVQFGSVNIKNRLPGELTEAQYLANSRQTNKPNDHGQSDSTRLLLSVELPLDAWRLATDLSFRRSHLSADLPSEPTTLDTKTESTRLGTRLWRQFESGMTQQRILLGLDIERWRQNTDGELFGGYANANPRITQESQSIYARHEVTLKPADIKFFVGVRHTEADRLSVGNPPGKFKHGNTSWDFGTTLRVGPTSELFGKIGTSFRLPNANEYTCYVQFCPGGAAQLLPQTSRDFDLGWRQRLAWGDWSVRYYLNNLNNEIGYDPGVYSNVNFDPTRREGVELEAKAKLSKRVDVGLQLATRRAVFLEGVYAGNTVPLVPNSTFTAHITFQQSASQQWIVSTQMVSAQRIGEDFDNTSPHKIPAYSLLNVRYNHALGLWSFSAVVNNLLDKKYYNYRTYADSIYPESGRTFLLTAQRRF